MLSRGLLLAGLVSMALAADVRVEILSAQPGNAKVTTAHAYDSQVTLSIENSDGSLTPSGWSTRKEGGGNGQPFSFTPGQGLIQGWTDGVLQMREGERARIHVPSAKGYGGAAQGQKGGAWYIPANSDLLFDIGERTRAVARGSATFVRPFPLPSQPPTRARSFFIEQRLWGSAGRPRRRSFKQTRTRIA